MKLRLNAALVKQLLDDSINATEYREVYERPGTAAPGLWLVGDQGVYLMSNSKDGIKNLNSAKGPPKLLVAYADKCNPVGTCEDWYANKRQAFGGDDGIEFLPIEFIEAALAKAKNGQMALLVTPMSISVPE